MSVDSPSPHRGDLHRTLEELVAAASLPPVVSTHDVGGRGFDNELLVAILNDGRRVLLRQNSDPAPSPVARAQFLATHDVGAPQLYAADDSGAVLVEFVPGETLAAKASRGSLTDRDWRNAGRAYGRIHAVRFHAPLRGSFGPQRLELTPQDPVALLHAKVDAGEATIRDHRPAMVSLLDSFRSRIDVHADELRQEVPCLVHADANFHNLVVGPDRVTLIDWDYPGVQYPLEELEAFETHAYLNGLPELPDVFFAGYGREVSLPLLRIHRVASCLQDVASAEWSAMADDDRNPDALRSMLRGWTDRLRQWIYRLDEHIAQI